MTPRRKANEDSHSKTPQGSFSCQGASCPQPPRSRNTFLTHDLHVSYTIRCGCILGTSLARVLSSEQPIRASGACDQAHADQRPTPGAIDALICMGLIACAACDQAHADQRLTPGAIDALHGDPLPFLLEGLDPGFVALEVHLSRAFWFAPRRQRQGTGRRRPKGSALPAMGLLAHSLALSVSFPVVRETKHYFTIAAIRGCLSRRTTFRSRVSSSIDIVNSRCVCGVASCPNRARRAGGGQSQLRNNCSLSLRSVAVSTSWPTASSPRSGFPSASENRAANAASGTPTFSLKASVSPARVLRSSSIRKSSVDFESRSESRGLRRRAIVASWADPASRVVVAPSVGVHVATGIPAAPESVIALRKVLSGWSSLAARLAHNQEVAGSNPAPATNFSSGDGPGILEPGSMTWGDRCAMPAPSGRARDRAICPAVARSFLRNAA